MNWYYNLKISVKLLSAFIIVALIAGAIGWIGVVKLHDIDAADTKLYEKMTVPLGEVGAIMVSFQRQRCNLAELMFADSQEKVNDLEKRSQDRDKEMDALEASFQKTLLTERSLPMPVRICLRSTKRLIKNSTKS